jgi:hypothetical protein
MLRVGVNGLAERQPVQVASRSRLHGLLFQKARPMWQRCMRFQGGLPRWGSQILKVLQPISGVGRVAGRIREASAKRSPTCKNFAEGKDNGKTYSRQEE